MSEVELQQKEQELEVQSKRLKVLKEKLLKEAQGDKKWNIEVYDNEIICCYLLIVFVWIYAYKIWDVKYCVSIVSNVCDCDCVWLYVHCCGLLSI